MKLTTILNNRFLRDYPLKLALYTAVIFGASLSFVSLMGFVATMFQQYVEQSVAALPKQTTLPRADVPNTPVVPSPTVVAAVPSSPLAPEQPFSSIAEVAAPALSTAAVVSPPTDTFTQVAPPVAAGDMRVLSAVTIRAMPDNNGNPLGTIEAGAIVTPVATENGWIQISQFGNVLGWVYQRFLEPAT